MRIDREAVESWTQWLDEFEAVALPLFEARGYQKDAALIIWHLNEIVNALTDDSTENWRDSL